MLFQSSLLTPYLLATACQQAYADIPAPVLDVAGDWLFLAKSEINNYAYLGVAYVHRSAPHVIIAHRGTNAVLLGNLLSAASLAISRLPESQAVAKQFSEQVRASIPKNYTVTETGHSLGGFHAEMNVALLNSGYTATFESPGVGDICGALNLTPDTSRFISFFSNPNVINTAKAHIGALYRVCTYHVEEDGYRLDQEGYFTALASALLRSTTPQESAINAGIVVARITLQNVTRRQVLSHSLEGLIRAMHPQVGYPYLLRQIQHWPSLQQFLAGQLPDVGSGSSSATPSPSTSSSSSSSSSSQSCVESSIDRLESCLSLVEQNRAAELRLASLQGYQVGEFVVPTQQQLADVHAVVFKGYQVGVLARFDMFFEETHSLRVPLQQILGLPAQSTTTLSSSAVVPEQLNTNMPSSSTTTPTMLTISPMSATMFPTTQMNLSPIQQQRVEPSLVSRIHLLEEQHWLISLAKSPGDANHVFLVLEGIKDEQLIRLRADFFLDLNKEVYKRSIGRSLLGIPVRAFEGNSLLGGGFVKITDLVKKKEENPNGYLEFTQHCDYQSWRINQVQAGNLLQRFDEEVKIRDYNYVRSGNHPSSNASPSGKKAHNCASWCQMILRNELQIEVGSKWSLIKSPSVIMGEVMQAEKQQTGRNASTASSSSLSSVTGLYGRFFQTVSPSPVLQISPLTLADTSSDEDDEQASTVSFSSDNPFIAQ